MKHPHKAVNGKVKILHAFFLIWALSAAGAAWAGEGGRPEISFYHWRTVYDPGPESVRRLTEVGATRLYLRFFEVTVDDAGRPVPQATAIFQQKPALPLVPVIFLENRVFRGPGAGADLAEKLLKRVLDMAEQNALTLAPELHVDCDWTPGTKEAFFEFTESLKKQLPPGWELAVTLRLDQYKNYRVTGVPPAHRGVLMAYNMGELKTPGPGNSILDPRIAARYLPKKHPYPLPLDLALPIFQWLVVFDEYDRYQGLLSPIPPQLNDPAHCVPIGSGMYAVAKPFQLAAGWPLLKNWRLRLEDSSQSELLALTHLLQASLAPPRRLIFYHLDEDLIQSRSQEDLETIAKSIQNK